MRGQGFAWECSCGNMQFQDEVPEECEKCGALDSFLKMPEESLKAREQDMIEEEIGTDISKKIKAPKAKKLSRSKKK